MRNVPDKSCTENQNTFYEQLFFDKCAVYEIMWKNTEQPDRPQIYSGASALHAGHFRLQAHTQNA
jgi:hypothetical protein